jgi:thiol-disulfide isomerase/thioredoxin
LGLQLEEYISGKPAILYFTTQGCVPCKTVQAPALRRVSEIYQEQLQIIKIDALEQSHLADAWGVLSVPTTFIIDSDGRPRGVNHGVAREPKLLAQLEAASETAPAQLNQVHAQSGVQSFRE